MASSIQVESEAVSAALAKLSQRVDDMTPFLIGIGEDMIARIKERFATATGPDGQPWKPNSQATIMNYLQSHGGTFSKKTGKITAKGQQLAMNKKPLQGETGDLARQFNRQVYSGNTLVVSSSVIYAAMQQFGGTKAQFPKLWGDIPARPFMPITSDGRLYPDEETRIVAGLQQYLLG